MPFTPATVKPPSRPLVDAAGQPVSRRGLINFKSNLRDIKYGSGNGAPYVVTPIPEYYEPAPSVAFGRDIFGRTGRSARAATDVTRLSRFYQDGKGLLFDITQNSLQKLRPKTPYGPPRAFSFSTVLAQATVSGTGIHLDSSIVPVTRENTYSYKTTHNFNENNTNRLTLLYQNKVALTQGLKGEFNITGRENQTSLIRYSGGPKSSGGIGFTTLRRYTTTNGYYPGLVQNEQTNPEGYSYTQQNVFAFTNTQIALQNSENKPKTTGFNKESGITNFITTINNNTTQPAKTRILGRTTDYEQFNRVDKFGTGDPGKDKDSNKQTYYEGAPKKTHGTDLINYNKIYTSDEGTVNTGQGYDDLIKFHIAVVDNDNPQKRTFIHFRAFIDNFADNFGATWSSTQYPGRGEEFFKYGGFSRDISLSFKVHIASRAELFPTYQKLNYLSSLMAPDYSAKAGFMRGNIVQLTIGDYLNNVYGVITGFGYNITTDSNWDIARNDDGSEDENSAELPTLIEVSGFNFKPIHNFIPEKTTPLSPNSKFISMGSDHKGYKFTTEEQASAQTAASLAANFLR